MLMPVTKHYIDNVTRNVFCNSTSYTTIETIDMEKVLVERIQFNCSHPHAIIQIWLDDTLVFPISDVSLTEIHQDASLSISNVQSKWLEELAWTDANKTYAINMDESYCHENIKIKCKLKTGTGHVRLKGIYVVYKTERDVPLEDG